MTEFRPTFMDRLLRRAPLDPLFVQQGKDAFIAGRHDNPYPRGTLAHRSWKKGYDLVDDWNYVW